MELNSRRILEVTKCNNMEEFDNVQILLNSRNIFYYASTGPLSISKRSRVDSSYFFWNFSGFPVWIIVQYVNSIGRSSETNYYIVDEDIYKEYYIQDERRLKLERLSII